jgi:hypothetical protein
MSFVAGRHLTNPALHFAERGRNHHRIEGGGNVATGAGVAIDAPSKTLKLQRGLAYARRSLWG